MNPLEKLIDVGGALCLGEHRFGSLDGHKTADLRAAIIAWARDFADHRQRCDCETAKKLVEVSAGENG